MPIILGSLSAPLCSEVGKVAVDFEDVGELCTTEEVGATEVLDGCGAVPFDGLVFVTSPFSIHTPSPLSQQSVTFASWLQHQDPSSHSITIVSVVLQAWF